MGKKRNISSVLLPLGIAAGVVGGIFIGKYEAVRRLSPGQEKLQTILGLIRDQYVDDINVDSLMEQTIPEMLASLDPHSAYIPKSELTASNEELDGAFGGVGVSFQILSDTVRVIEVIPGGPAELVGMQPGDQILEANGKKMAGVKITNQDVYTNLRGKEGTKVSLTVKRKNIAKHLHFDVVRDKIPEYSVDSKYMIADNTGYIRISKFARTTYNEFFNALVELRNKGAKKFIFDLRNNSGGFMDQAIYMANEFLPAGRRTFGKGLVQNPIMLPDSSSIRLTVARYYTPAGRSIQKEYKRGRDGKYELDILDRYSHGEFYSQDSIKLDKSKIFHTPNGRTVHGGGGIMPDVFVPEDTTGITSYYLEALNRGLIQRFAGEFAEKYRPMIKKKTIDDLTRVMPRENMLLQSFVSYAAANGLPARWFYINKSRDLLLNQLKAVIARDLIGFNAFIEILNRKDTAVPRALEALERNESPVNIIKK